MFQAMRAPGIHRDIAGNGAGQLRRGVRRVKESQRFQLGADRQVGHPGLHADKAVCGVDLQHVAQAHGADDHAVRRRQRAPGQRGARTARHHRHPQLVTDPHRRRDLRGRARQDHRQRRAAIGGQRVAFIGAGFLKIGNHRILGQHRAQGGNDLRRARQHARIGFGHGDAGHGGLLLISGSGCGKII